MAFLVLLILVIYMSVYLSSNVGITSGVERYWGEKGVARWSNLCLKVYFASICLSLGLLTVYRQFDVSNVFDIIAIASVTLNTIVWIKNLVSMKKWSASELIKDKDWWNGFLVDLTRIYIFCYTIIKVFLLGFALE